MAVEFEQLVELNPRLETQRAVAIFRNSPVVQVINQVALNFGNGNIYQAAANFAGALALRL